MVELAGGSQEWISNPILYVSSLIKTYKVYGIYRLGIKFIIYEKKMDPDIIAETIAWVGAAEEKLRLGNT